MSIPSTSRRCMIAYIRSIVFVLYFAVSVIIMILAAQEIQTQAEVIKSLETSVSTQNEHIAKLEAENERLNQEISSAALEKAVSRGAEMKRLRVDELREIAGVVHAEAKGEPYEGKKLVAKVILNRMRWNPDKTVHEILTSPNQFAPCEPYDTESMDAVVEAMMDKEYSNLAGFHNPETATNPEAKEHTILLTVGNHVFW